MVAGALTRRSYSLARKHAAKSQAIRRAPEKTLARRM
jgi:hypothetical protein